MHAWLPPWAWCAGLLDGWVPGGCPYCCGYLPVTSRCVVGAVSRPYLVNGWYLITSDGRWDQVIYHAGHAVVLRQRAVDGTTADPAHMWVDTPRSDGEPAPSHRVVRR